MVARKPVTQPEKGKYKPTLLRFSEYMCSYLDRRCDESGKKLIEVVTESIQDGEYYREDLAKTVENLFASETAIRDEYYKPFMGGRPHHSYVTEEPLSVESLAVSLFIRKAIEEKIERDAPGYHVESKEERMEHWGELHQQG